MKARALTLALALLAGCTSSPDEPDAGAPDAGAEDGGVVDAGGGLDASVDAGILARCDEEGEVCCADGSCGNGLPCMEGLCGYFGCGEIGTPCCGTGFCRILSGAVCEDGLCVEPHCGSEGYECCASGPACREDFVCHEGTCLRCGALGEQCCPGGVCDDGLPCAGEPGTLGQCVTELPPCGGEGEQCCSEGPACGAGLGCQDGACLPGPACGAERRVCCDTEPRCGTAMRCAADFDGVERCQRCGEHDMPCCADPTPCGPELACVEAFCRLPTP